MTATVEHEPAQFDEAHLTLYAERAMVAKRVVDTVSVQARRVTSEHDETVEQELSTDEVVVERIAIGRVVDATPPVRQEGDTTVFSVVEEIVVVERRLVLKEEVHIRRVRSSRPHSQTVTLRQQDVVVTRTEIDAGPAATGTMADVAPSTDSTQPSPSPQGHRTMTDETIVAVYDTPAHAALAVADLKEAGVPDSAVTTHVSGGTDTAATARTEPREEGFWASLFGGSPDHDTTVYERSVASGGTVVTVKVPSEHADKVGQMLESHNPIDIDERATGYGLTAKPAQPVAAMTSPTTARRDDARTDMGADTMKLSEERLTVGKRVVNRGGTRIRRFVVETPVEEQVTLHDERVTIDRHPVTDGRAVSDADFSEKTIEMRETAEEAVVSKQAYVTEEIALRKTGSDRVETIKDTVRKEDVEVVQLPNDTTTSTTNPAKPRT